MIILAGVLVVGMVSYAQAICTLATLKGNFGFEETGTRLDGTNPGPRAAVGSFTADGLGHLTGSYTKSNNGTISDVTSTGTYSVNPNCTGSGTETHSDGEVRHFDFVILLGKQILFIQTDAGRVKTGAAAPRMP